MEASLAAYTGISNIQLNDNELADFYEGKYSQNFYQNQYIIIRNTKGEIVDKGKWVNGFAKLKYKKIQNDNFGKFAPRQDNIYQEMAFDSIQGDATCSLISAGYGCGKSIISFVHALDMVLSKSKYQRIIYIRQNVETANTNSLGALPGTLVEKLMPYCMPFADILGSVVELKRLIDNEVILLDHIGFLRGRSYKDCVVIVSEAQDVTSEHMALIVSRIADNTKLIVEGDLSQCDKDIFRKRSGMVAMAETLKGDPEFSMVTMYKNERSRFASLSNKISGYYNE